MSLKLRISKEAEQDILSSYKWYEERRQGLGDEFLAELEITQQSIIEHPKSFPVRYRDLVRACVTRRFPYLILYILETDSINIIAVFHTKRKPESWTKRLSE